ncbi:hypothetical protein M8J75_000808 [Diaphorina citri]|nr:hypothetical protein M8J75_000808 [Diaphorina citri]
MKDNGDKAATDTNGGEDKPSPFSIATAKQVGYLTKWWRWDVEICKRKDGSETVMKDNGDKAATDTNGGEDKPSPFSIATAKQVGYLTKWWRWDVEM